MKIIKWTFILGVILIATYYVFTFQSKQELITVISAEPPVDRVLEKISEMPLDEKIGQMMIVGFETPYVDEHIKDMITRYFVGGVNLLGRNVQNEAQVKSLTRQLQDIASSTTGIPFMIAVDQEGGSVVRFRFLEHRATQLSLASIDSAYDEAYARGEELKRLGVTVNFAPVADYVSNKKSYLYARTFATTSDMIAPLAAAMRKGYEEAGIQATIKHFPGYGNILNDPHRSGAKTDSSIYRESLQPFKDLLSNRKAGAVMTAHIIIPEVDEKPATLSSRFLKDMLRNEWKFDGVIITDDLEMASAGNMPVEQLVVEAVRAGNDMIISTYTSALHPKIHEALKAAVIARQISEAEIDSSVARILRFKKYKNY